MGKPIRASRAFQIFAKPVGPLCNLDCRYCYSLQKGSLYPQGGSFRMAEDLLEAYIAQQIEIAPEPDIHFSWHGGEPTILGLDHFRRIVALQRKHLSRGPVGSRIVNSIQTNGTLLDDDWCRFFAAEHFAVGLSMDGPPRLHDAYRTTKDNKASHRQVMQGYRLLQRHKIPVDLLCVVHGKNVQAPLDVYHYFKEIQAQYLSIIPLLEPEPGSPNGVTERTVPAEAFGAFLCTIFDEWIRQDMGRIIVQGFEEAARPAYGLDHSLCVFRPTCGDCPVIEHNGDFYRCDHFVTPEHRLGNIRETPLLELLESTAQQAFGQAKQETLPRCCRECGVLDLCNGGCPKDRILRTPDGEPGLNYLCAGYQRFFNYCHPFTARMAALRWAGHPPEQLMEELRREAARTMPRIGRNDPCPCGSGKKYKKCCLRE